MQPALADRGEDADIVPFRFTLVPAHKPDELHDNMRSAIARDLPAVTVCQPHDGILSIAGGGPSLEDTYSGLTGYVASINGTLGFLLDRDVIPQMCGVCDPSPHMVDIIEADKRVTYFLASIVHPSVYDKLLAAGCTVYRWNASSVPGGEDVLAEVEPKALTIGGGSTMGLRWITLGYAMGFREFHLHGMDSSFRMDPKRGKASHAYPDHQDAKEWVDFDGFHTRVNFIGQVADFVGWLDRLTDDDVDPVTIKVFGEGLLQKKFRDWQGHNPGWHLDGTKPRSTNVAAGFKWPAADQMVRSNTLSGVRYMKSFLRLVPRKGTVVQAGGNVGVYPAHLAQHFERVYTFEPDPENYGLMIENLQGANGIRAFNAALGEKDGTCGLVQPDKHNTGDIRVSGHGDIPVRTLDDLGLEECDLIWLDVEGAEELVLKGAEQTIDRCRPCVIIEENGSPKHHGLAINGARAWLEERDYYFALRHERDTLMVPR